MRRMDRQRLWISSQQQLKAQHLGISFPSSRADAVPRSKHARCHAAGARVVYVIDSIEFVHEIDDCMTRKGAIKPRQIDRFTHVSIMRKLYELNLPNAALYHKAFA